MLQTAIEDSSSSDTSSHIQHQLHILEPSVDDEKVEGTVYKNCIQNKASLRYDFFLYKAQFILYGQDYLANEKITETQ